MSTGLPRHIVDPSIAIKWLFDDEDFMAEAGDVLLSYQAGYLDLLAPGHLYHEVSNARGRGVRMRRLEVSDAEKAMLNFLDLAIPTVAGPRLSVAGFRHALSYDCAFYDGLYLALGDQVGCPLMHADRR